MSKTFCDKSYGEQEVGVQPGPARNRASAGCRHPVQSDQFIENDRPQSRSTAFPSDGEAGCDRRALLINAPVGRHVAQIHRDASALAASVALFIEAGLRRGTGVIVIATPEHTAFFGERLAESDLDAAAFIDRGQLRVLNAERTMNEFMKSGMPDWADFQRTMGKVVESVQDFGHSSVRAYGEMVNVLWNSGRVQAAVRLEEYWNELARLYPFSLFCGYLLDSQNHESYSCPLHEIGRTHTNVIATDDDEAFRQSLESASRDLFGVSLTQLISCTGYEANPGESRLPLAQRTMLWITKNIPTSSVAVLQRARSYYENNRNATSRLPG